MEPEKFNLNSKRIPYPCDRCENQNQDSCREKHCAAWKDWFYEKWAEVTWIFRKIRGERK